MRRLSYEDGTIQVVAVRAGSRIYHLIKVSDKTSCSPLALDRCCRLVNL